MWLVGVTPLPPLGSSGTISELQAENHDATYSGKHRNKILPLKAAPMWGRHGRSIKGERDGWMDGWANKHVKKKSF